MTDDREELLAKIQELEDKLEAVFNNKIVAFIVKNPTVAKIVGLVLTAITAAVGFFFGG